MEEDSEFLKSKFAKEKETDSSVREEHSFYAYLNGKIKNPSNYDIDDPNSEIMLNNAEFFVDSAQKCFKEKSLELFFHKKFSVKDLEEAIRNYTQDGQSKLSAYSNNARSKLAKFTQRYKVDKEQAFGCCLALAYYTGDQSERISRSCNIIIKLYVMEKESDEKEKQQYQAMRCIGQWLFKALNYIPLYWGKVTRCVNIKPSDEATYTKGNIVTWLQFSSSSHANISAYFATRNSRFVIYSLSGRCIEEFSLYEKSESQVLFKPYSHFMVLKTQRKDGKFIVYMRQIFIGQSSKNVLWVDDNIFDKNWENKKYIERAIIQQPLLGIIPKISTECAMAFLRSELVKNHLNQKSLKIMSDMTRKNEWNPSNAGARLAKQCEKLKIFNDYLIFTSGKETAQKKLKELKVELPNLKISVKAEDALNFLKFQ